MPSDLGPNDNNHSGRTNGRESMSPRHKVVQPILQVPIPKNYPLSMSNIQVATHVVGKAELVLHPALVRQGVLHLPLKTVNLEAVFASPSAVPQRLWYKRFREEM